MRYIRYACIAIFAIALVVISLANREMVTIKVLPEQLGAMSATNPSMQVPLFVVMFAGIVLGLLIGFVWEFMIEQRKLADAKRKAAEAEKLRREVARLKAEKHQGKDEVLALLDEAS